MRPAWLVVRAGLRSRWRPWLTLAIVAGLAGGLVIAVAAGARRTDAAYPALVSWSHPPDDLLSVGADQVFASAPAARVKQLPQVASMASLTNYTPLLPASAAIMAPDDSSVPDSAWHRKLLAGRLPAPGRADEADISFTIAQSMHLQVGDLMAVTLATAAGKPVPFRFRVAGIDAAPSEFPPQYGLWVDTVWATPAFNREAAARLASSQVLAVWLRHGAADVPAVEGAITRMTGGKVVSDYPLDPQAANTRRTIGEQAVVLWLLAGLLTLLGACVLGQLLARLTAMEAGDYPTLRALGMRPVQLAAAGLIRAALIGIVGAVVAVVVALAASPAFPVGLAAVAEPRPGFAADWLACGLGALGVVVAAVACAFLPAHRAAPGPARLTLMQLAYGGPAAGGAVARGPLGQMPGGWLLPAVLGARLGLHRGRGTSAVPVRSAVSAAVVGIIGLAAAAVFSASLGHLLATPALCGETWDAFVVDSQNLPIGPVARVIASDPSVAQSSPAYLGVPVQVNGVPVSVVTTQAGPGAALAAVLLHGRAPNSPADIVLGQRTLAAAHARVGGTVRVEVPGMGRAVMRTVVGTAVFPAVADQAQLGIGAEMTISGLLGVAPPGVPVPPPGGVLVRFRDSLPGSASPPSGGTSGEIAALAARVDRMGPWAVAASATPADLVNFGQLQDLPLLVGLALGAVAALTIAHLLLTSVRRRRRDFAILRVLGCTPRQVHATLAWMAVTVEAAALAAGIPAGIVCGRLAWQAFAGQLGIEAQTQLPPGFLAVVLAAALLLAAAIAGGAAMVVSRGRLAPVLRAD